MPSSQPEQPSASDPADLAAWRNNLGNALRTRYGQTGDVRDLDRAIDLFEAAAATDSPDPLDRAIYLDNLALALRDRSDRDGDTDVLDRAVGLHQAAVAAAPAGSPERPRLLSNLGGAWRELYRSTGGPQHLQQALGAFQEAVASTPQSSPALPFYLDNLAVGLSGRYHLTGDPADLDEAVELHRKAIELAGTDSPDQPRYLTNLGVCLQERYGRTGQPEDLDRAVEALDQAVRRTRPTAPALPGRLDQLGIALARRFQATTRRPDDLTRAVAALEQAVARTPPEFPGQAERINNLGVALRIRYERTTDHRDLSRAVELFRAAAAAADPDDRAFYLDNLATGNRALYEHTGELAHLDLAVQAHEDSLAEATEPSAVRTGYLNNLGNTLRTRHAAGGQARDLDRAQRAFEEALAGPIDGSDREMVLDNLALSLRDRYGRTGDLASLERAIELHREAVTGAPTDSPYRPQLLANLAGALLTRYGRSNALSDLDEAIDLLEQVVAVTGGESPDRPVRLSNLAIGLRARHDRTEDPDDLDRAIALHQEALAMTPPSAPDRSMYLVNLGVCLRTRYDHTGDLTHLEEAVAAFRQAVEATPEGSPDLAARLHNLAGGLRDRFEHTGAPADLTTAVDTYRRSVRQGMEAGAEFGLGAARRWGAWAGRRQRWPEAAEAYELGIRLFHRLFRIQLLRQHKEVWLGEQEELWTRGAYALARAGKLQAAVAALEAGRAMLLSEALERDRADLGALPELGRGDLLERYREAADELRRLEGASRRPGGPEPTPPQRDAALRSARDELDAVIDAIRQLPGYAGLGDLPSFEEVASTAAVIPLVYLAATDHGGLALVVRAGSSVEPVWLPALTGQEVRAAVNRYLQAYLDRREDPATWRAVLGQVTHWLWQVAMGPVLETLAPTPRAACISTSLLGLLPLHAAWTEDASSATGRRYAFDQVVIGYTPNARALGTAMRVAEGLPADGVLGIDDPQPVTAEPLPNTSREVRAALAAFPRHHHLRGVQATRASVLDGLDGWPVLHFACHASADPAAPLNSGLLLANDEVLTLRDVMEQRLTGVRLAVLSGCETAVAGRELPDEAVSLPTGFMEAGIPGVVGSLWAVRDISTTLLMVRFYQLWRHDRLEPADALRRAQQWVRDATNAEKEAALPDIPELAGPPGRAARAFWAEARAHSDPGHWAAFAYVGV